LFDPESIINGMDPGYFASQNSEMTEEVASGSPRDNDKGSRPGGRSYGYGDRAFKPYYVAHTKIQILALLDEKYKGSIWYQRRRR